jgi:phage-related minor tail protein
MIMEMADAAMKEAERAAKEGLIEKAAKKQMVIDAVKAGCKAAGVNLDDFIDQLSAYIDDTIKFVNEMKK